MCPSGQCVSNFEECRNKNYECTSPFLEKCGDGFCRESCDGIPTNGCPVSKPVYCQNGSCVQFTEECFSFQCPLDKPILCSNNVCAQSFLNCPTNVLSSLINKTEHIIKTDINSSIIETILIASSLDPSDTKLQLNIPRNSLYYPSFSAAFFMEKENEFIDYETPIKISPVPKSDYEDTKLRYTEFNLDAEQLSNKIFTRRLGLLEPFQFLRSFVFEISLKHHTYNNHLFRRPITAVIDYNIINGYPSIKEGDLTLEEESDIYDEEYLKRKKSDLDKIYDPSDLESFYCLGILNPITNLWQCANRTIADFSSESMTYQIPSPGIYAILFFPKLYESELGRCGVMCRNKPFIVRSLCFYLPVLFIWILYFFYNLKKTFNDILSIFKNSSKIEKRYFNLKHKLEQKRLERQKLEKLQKVSNFAVFQNAKKTDKDLEEIRNLLNEKNYDIKSDIKTFVNPMVFSKGNFNEMNAKINSMEKKVLNLRFKRKELTKSKIWKINKLIILKEQILEFQQAINGLNSIEGNKKIYLDEYDEVDLSGSSRNYIKTSLLSSSNVYDSSIKYFGGRSRRNMISKKTFSDDESVSYGD
jgi:hypothetical protein